MCCLSSFFYSQVNYIVCLCFRNEKMVKPVQNTILAVLKKWGSCVEFCRKHGANWCKTLDVLTVLRNLSLF